MSDVQSLITVRPAPNRRVVSPCGAAVPTVGFRVDPRDPWWARALRNGDVVELEANTQAVEADQAVPAPNKATPPSHTEEKK